jgi:hypothetical protein
MYHFAELSFRRPKIVDAAFAVLKRIKDEENMELNLRTCLVSGDVYRMEGALGQLEVSFVCTLLFSTLKVHNIYALCTGTRPLLT